MSAELSSEMVAADGPRATLVCHALHDWAPKIVSSRSRRAWMDAFPDRHIYRCLPIAIANSFGWDVLCPAPIEIEWNGGPAVGDLSVRALKSLPGNMPVEHFCKSHFSSGIVTMHPDYIFRTDPGWSLLATGPFNGDKENAVPLSGIIETDWLPYTFTMNWKLLRAGTVHFEEDEPFCSIFPLQIQPVVACEPEIRRLSDDPELERQHQSFRQSRDAFMAKMSAGDAETRKQPWQKHYFMGRFADGTKVEEHLNKLRLQQPVDRRGPAPETATANVDAASLWAGDSPLNEIDHAQSSENELGRKRLSSDGRLIDWSKTHVIRSAKDAEGCDFLVVDDLLTAEQCATIAKSFWDLEGQLFKSDKIDPYWNNRFLWLADIEREKPEAAGHMIGAQKRAIRLVQDFYALTVPIYADLLQLVRWQPGMFMPPHADNANPDGSDHGMAYRAFAGIIYINDDYQGGELYFTGLDMAIKPKRGTFVAMTGGFHHEHAVLRVDSGIRLTMPSFMTFDRTKADPRLIG